MYNNKIIIKYNSDVNGPTPMVCKIAQKSVSKH